MRYCYRIARTAPLQMRFRHLIACFIKATRQVNSVSHPAHNSIEALGKLSTGALLICPKLDKGQYFANIGLRAC